jgi:GNAT superfamily N-acetyltransferase
MSPSDPPADPGAVENGFRAATVEDVSLLRGLVLDGVRHWGHDVNFPAAFAGLEAEGLPTAEFIGEHVVEVLVDRGEPTGFYSLVDRGEGIVELEHMFVLVDRIGSGVGRRLWQRAVGRARESGRRLLIMSDPEAVGFYASMGAVLECRVEPSPGFELGKMWFDLPADRT